MRSYRVVQWATGALGRSVIRGLAERPEFELAGVLVYNPDKVGRDAGDLVGDKPMGVTATCDVEAVLAMDADCVVYTPLPSAIFADDPHGDLKTICRLLASGKNVVTTIGLIYPYAHGPEVVSLLVEACQAGGTSVHGTGVNPGFMGDAMPLVLSGLSRYVSHVYVRECSDFAGHPSRRLVFDLLGFGRPEMEYKRTVRRYRTLVHSQFAESIHLVAAGLGVAVDDVEAHHEFNLADEGFEIAAGSIPAGTVCAAQWRFTGLVSGRPFVTIEAIHKADAGRSALWARPGYSLRIEGRPSIAISADAEWVTDGLAAAAAHAINAIPPVCDAPPGIRTILDLPPIRSRGMVSDA